MPSEFTSIIESSGPIQSALFGAPALYMSERIHPTCSRGYTSRRSSLHARVNGLFPDHFGLTRRRRSFRNRFTRKVPPRDLRYYRSTQRPLVTLIPAAALPRVALTPPRLYLPQIYMGVKYNAPPPLPKKCSVEHCIALHVLYSFSRHSHTYRYIAV